MGRLPPTHRALLAAALLSVLASPPSAGRPSPMDDGASPSAGGSRDPSLPRGHGRIPEVAYVPTRPARRPPLRRTHDLLQLFSEGAGRLEARGLPDRLAKGVRLQAVPWRVAPERRDRVRLAAWPGGEDSAEASLSLVLGEGESWCAELEAEPGSRLRLDPLALEAGRPAGLLVRWPAGAEARRAEAAPPASLRGGMPLDHPLAAGRGRLCLLAEGGAVALGEPRLLAPEGPGDPRPRWVVLTVMDALRADQVAGPHAAEDAPGMTALARRGRAYLGAISPGCHTWASAWPLLTGRDVMRIDPLMLPRYAVSRTPTTLVYARSNLPVTHAAAAAGYHPVFLGNNSFYSGIPAFARFSNHGRVDTGTVDTIRELPALLSRYADERVLLVTWVSSPHRNSTTPARLLDRLGCDRLEGVEQELCAYRARVRHADEAFSALESALADHGLAADTLHVLTADHGELFRDGVKLEAEMYGKWLPLDESHGGSCHLREIHVPLVVAGPGVPPGREPTRVSTLDVVPTLLAVLGQAPVSALDGRALPLRGRPPQRARFTSYGFCSHSVLEPARQLIWWRSECASRRVQGSSDRQDNRAEVWTAAGPVATERTAPATLEPLLQAHRQWVNDRLPGEALVIDAARAPRGRLRVTALAGRIVDYGPSATVRLDGLAGVHLSGERSVTVHLAGYPGLFQVSTRPERVPVRVEFEPEAGASPPLVFVGPLQVPVAVLGQTLDPSEQPDLLVSPGDPGGPPAPDPHLRLWWQPYRGAADADGGPSATDLDRVLREWGYIR